MDEVGQTEKKGKKQIQGGRENDSESSVSNLLQVSELSLCWLILWTNKQKFRIASDKISAASIFPF